MNAILKLTVCILLMVVITFISCSKNSSLIESPRPPTQSPDTLSGREFEFNDLKWKEILSPGPNVILDIGRPDLFFNPFREMKVTMRHDTSTIWLDILQDTGSSYPAGYHFFYTIGGSDFFTAFSGHLYIYPKLINHSLTGTTSSIKVKFL